MDQSYSQRAIGIVIPFRNERRHLEDLQRSLEHLQRGPGDSCLLVDDESEDGGSAEIKPMAFVHVLNFRPGEGGSKKKALAAGIAATNQSYILTSDADCVFQPGWINAMRSAIEPGTRMVIGPVLVRKASGFTGWIQQPETLVLLAITMRSARAGMPLLCSGANLLFSREAYREVNGYTAHLHRSSGDDVLLLQALRDKRDQGIVAVDDPMACVYTSAADTWVEWYAQRRRWISKTGHVNRPLPALLSLLLLVQLFLPLALLGIYWPVAVLIPFAEYFFVWTYAKRYGRAFYIGDWFFFRFIYPVAVLLLFLSAPFIKPCWKGRRVT